MKHKVVQLGIMSLAATVLITGCSGGAGPDSKPGAGEDYDLVNPGVLTVLATQDTRPTSFVEDGEIQGLAVDMWEYIGEQMGLEVEYKIMAVDTGLSAISAGQLDSASTGLVASPERQRNLDFSKPWIYGYYGILVREDSDVDSLESLAGKTVAVIKSSDPSRLLSEEYPEIQQRAFGDSTAQIVAVNSGQVDATLLGNNGISAAIEQYPTLKVVDEVPLPYPNGFPVRKGNTGLLDAINDSLTSMMDDGTFVSLYRKWHPHAPFPEGLFEDYPSLEAQLGS